MEQEKLAEMIKSLIEKDKENFIKKEVKMETKKYKKGGEVRVNKKHCYKSKKYQFKPVFLIKVFNEMTYNIETNGDPDEPASIKGAHIKW